MIDHAEFANVEALAHRWWDRESEFNLCTTSSLRVTGLINALRWPTKKYWTWMSWRYSQ